MDMISIDQAFEMMLSFIEQFQKRGPFEDTGKLLSVLYKVNGDDEATRLWQEWCFCVQKTLQFTGLPNTFPTPKLAQASLKRYTMSSNTLLTILQAYLATQLFLARQYFKIKGQVEAHHKESGIFYLMSNMDLGARMEVGLSIDVIPADPAYWADWMRSVQHVLLPDTPENQQLVNDLIRHENLLGQGPLGEEWYAHLLPDGKQLWAEVYHGDVQCAGIRQTPIDFDPRTGLSTPLHP